MKKIKILYLYSAADFGGIVRNLSIIVNNLNLEAFEPHVMLLSSQESNSAKVRMEKSRNIPYMQVSDDGKFATRPLRAIAEYLNRHQINILSCHGYKSDVFGYLAKRLIGRPIRTVSIAHGWVTPGFKMQCYYLLDKLVMRSFDRVVLVSKAQRKDIRGFFFPESRVSVIHNAIDADKFCRSSTPIDRESFGLPGSSYLLGFAGRLSREKDIATTLRAIQLAGSGVQNLAFIVAGEGPERERLENLAVSLRISKRVAFPGYQHDMGMFYGMLDAYVSSSLREGLPNNILEAQAYQIPCIASQIGGHDEIIQHRVNGLLFEPGNPQELAGHIGELAKNCDLQNQLKARAKENLLKHFSVKVRIAKLESLYNKLVDPRRMATPIGAPQELAL
jgi:glycosyltransferase involved in cell wall biosynthesis